MEVASYSNRSLEQALCALSNHQLKNICRDFEVHNPCPTKASMVERIIEFANPVMRRDVIRRVNEAMRRKRAPDAQPKDDIQRWRRSLLDEFDAAATPTPTPTPAAEAETAATPMPTPTPTPTPAAAAAEAADGASPPLKRAKLAEMSPSL